LSIPLIIIGSFFRKVPDTEYKVKEFDEETLDFKYPLALLFFP